MKHNVDNGSSIKRVSCEEARVCPIASAVAKNRNTTFLHCQVCGILLCFDRTNVRLVVVCHRCLEATPVRWPPREKIFYRCQCHALILMHRNKSIFNCPRENCRRLLVTEMAKKKTQYIWKLLDERIQPKQCVRNLPTHSIAAHNVFSPKVQDKGGDRWEKVEIRCGACSSIFYLSPAMNPSTCVRCPSCRRFTSLSSQFPNRRGLGFLQLSLLGLIITFSVGLGSYTYRHKNGGHYVFSSGFLVMSLFLLWQSIFYFRMPVSTITSKW
ncbi:Transmembrane protein 55A [Sparganum proliferum]